MSLDSIIKKGLNWSFLNQGYHLLAQFTLGVWLARILGPEVYGTVAMITVFSAFAQMFVDFGFSAALVQKENVTDKDYSTIFWFNLFVGIILCTVFYLSSELIADFYKKQELVLYAKVVSLQFVLSALALTQSVQLTKKVDFKTKSAISIFSSLFSFVIALILALNNFGVWSVIFQMLSSRILSILLLYYFVSWKPMIYFSKASFRNVYKFGLAVTGNTILNFAARNTDNLLIGKFIGDSSLGIYSKSYGIILFPIKNFSNVIKKVLFPSFSLLQSDTAMIRSYFLKTTSMIIYLIFPLMILLLLLAEEFVMLLFGKDWIEMVPLIKIFSVLGMFQSILTLNGTIYLSLGKASLALKIGVFSKLVILTCISVGVITGNIVNVAIALAVAQLINFYPVFYSSTRLIKLSLGDFFSYNVKIFTLLFISAIATFFFSYLQFDSMILQFFLKSLVFVICYIILSYLFKIKEFYFFLRKLQSVYSK